MRNLLLSASFLSALCASAQVPSATTQAAPTKEGSGAAGSPFVALSEVQVRDTNRVNTTTGSHRTVAAADVLSSAGTFGDFEKYLATLPGVVSNSDESNDALVRGGNPFENLYLVDGFEVPDINHITGMGTTGGFTSMIDTASIDKVDLLSGGYSAAYSERLSSVISVTTLGQAPVPTAPKEGEAGYVGVGGHTILNFGPGSQMLISAHRSILNLFTNDVGLNGVPIYTNGLVSGQFVVSPNDTLSILSLAGADSIKITPNNDDFQETNTIQTQYSGWRITNGLRWTHAFGMTATGALTLSDSENSEGIEQQNQALLQAQRFSLIATNNPTTPVYSEHTHDGMSIAQFHILSNLGSFWSFDAGSQIRIDRINYDVAQPVGEQSPYSASTAYLDNGAFAPNFAAVQNGTWAELTVRLSHSLIATTGGRLQYFATGGQHITITPRARVSYQMGEHHSIYAAFGEYAQQPSFIYIESYAQNKSLLPIFNQQIVLGTDIYKGDTTRVTLEAYRKHYWNYPVSTEYPEISLANLVDTLGQQYVWLPLISKGYGQDYGVELSAEGHLGKSLYLQGSAAYARAFYTGLDHIYRPGNYDFPVVLNSMLIWRPGHRYEASARYEYTTGRPYTPFLMSASLAQDRGIYNMQQVNTVRSPAYSRLDFQFARTFHPGKTAIYTFAGLENGLDRNNFLANAWTPHCANSQPCINQYGAYVAVSQIGLYPNFGARVYF
jgi:hypothetical protein